MVRARSSMLAAGVVAALVGGCSFTSAGTATDDGGATSGDDGRVTDAAGRDGGGPDAGTLAPIDAAALLPDAAPPFDVAACPATYDIDIGIATSRYRRGGRQSFGDALAGCASDAPGLTHLVVLDVAGEASGLFGAVRPGRYWVGAVQGDGQPTPDAGWHTLTGGVPQIDWAPNQPDDNNQGVEQGVAQAATMAPSGALTDEVTDSRFRMLCECDGLATP